MSKDRAAEGSANPERRRSATGGKRLAKDEQRLLDVLRAIRNVNQLITREKDRGALVRRAGEILTETRGYCSAWIVATDAAGRAEIVAESGSGEALAPVRADLWRDVWPACARQALAGEGVVVLRDPMRECGDCPLSHTCRGSAVLAAPLRHEGRNHGVLVAAVPRAAAEDDEERGLFAEVAGDLGLALHALDLEARRLAAEAREAHLKQVLLAIRHVSQLIVHEDDARRLVERACTHLTGTLGYFNAWIALLDGGGQCAVATATAGCGGQFEALRDRLARGEFCACARDALERDATVVVDDPCVQCVECPLSGEYGGRAGFARRLAFEGRVYGILAVSVPAAYAHDEEERSLFDEVAGDLGFALHKIELTARLREAEGRVRAKLNAVLSPEGDLGVLSLADVLDVPAIQRMMDDFHGLTGMCTALLDITGRILVAVGWQDICTGFHRVHPETCRNCTESDTVLSLGVDPGTFRIYHCKNNLWDMATPIMLGDRHAGNLFIGQFLFEGEEPDREVFRAQARQYGFDQVAYLAALDRLPRWSRERVTRAMAFFAALARQISDLSYGNIKLARTLAQRDGLLVQLGESEERLRLAMKATNDVVWDWDVANDSQRWGGSGSAVFGWTDIVAAPQAAAWWTDRIHPDDLQRVFDGFFAVVNAPGTERWQDEYRFRRADGTFANVVDRAYVLRDAGGRATRMIGAMLDITGIKESDERMTLLVRMLDEAPASITVHDTGGRFIFANHRTLELHGYASMDAFLAVNLHRLDVPESEALLAERFRQIDEEGEARFEAAHYRADGSILPLEVVARKITWHGQTAVLSIAVDITARKDAEETLHVALEKYQAIFDHFPLGISISDRAGKIVETNRESERLLDLPADEHTRRTIDDEGWGIVRPDGSPMPPEEYASVRALRENRVVASAEMGIVRRAGPTTWLAVTAAPIPLPGYGVAIAYGDVTARMQAEEALRESEERFRAASDASLDCMLLLRSERDEAGQIRDFVFVDLNRRAEEMLQRNRDQLLGRRLCEELPINRDAGFLEKYKRVVDTGVPLEEEFFLPETHVPAAWYYHQVVKVGDGVFICHRDIGEKKRAEAERERLQAQFLQAQKMESVGRLAGGVAHDFNNLLMGIMNYAELCRDGIAPDHPIRGWLDEIRTEANRSTNLVRQLLAFARKQTIMPKVVDLNDTVGNMLKMLRRLIGEDIDLVWQPGGALWSVKIDPGQVDQVLANLCVNARDAIGGVGKVSIATGNATIDEAYCAGHIEAALGTYVMLAVSDNGCGMAPEILEHIFEPFFTTKGVGEGTGLGLATVYGIVKQNQGFINVCSEPGKGTTFRVYLPRHHGGASVAAAPEDPSALPGGAETVLLVEDEKGVRVTTALFLERLGYTVLSAETADVALRRATEHPGTIGILITDVVMPGMSGRDLAARLFETHPSMKCLFISGYTADVIAHRGILDEGVHFLAKPFNRGDLARKVRQVLTSERTGGTTGPSRSGQPAGEGDA